MGLQRGDLRDQNHLPTPFLGEISPILGFSPQGRGALQDIDQLSLFKTLCKACISVRTVRDIVPALRKAISTAQSGTPGKGWGHPSTSLGEDLG